MQSDGVKVRLRNGTCHGLAGQIVTVSESRARALIERGDAVNADSEVPAIGGDAPAPEAASVFITVRLLNEGPLKGTIFRVEATHARRLITSGGAEEITF